MSESVALDLILRGRVFRTPLDLPGLQLWLDPSQLTGLVDADPVTTWTDLSGLGNHATQATVGKKPLYKTAILNGKPVLRFDGTDDGMQVASLTLSTFTIFVVFVRSVSGLTLVYEHSANVNSSDGSYLGTSIGNSVKMRRGAQSAGFDATSNWLAGGIWRVVRQAYKGSVSGLEAWVNGLPVALSDPGGNGTLGAQSVADAFNIASRNQASLFCAGDYAEMVVYSPALSDAAAIKVDRYLGQKYAIVVA